MSKQAGITLSSLCCLIIPLMLSCEGDMGNYEINIEEAHLTLHTDELGGLTADECVETPDTAECPRYPNPLGCDTVKIQISEEGNAKGECSCKDKPTRVIKSLMEGMPVVCQVNKEDHCVQCEDIFGHLAVDTCNKKNPHPFTKRSTSDNSSDNNSFDEQNDKSGNNCACTKCGDKESGSSCSSPTQSGDEESESGSNPNTSENNNSSGSSEGKCDIINARKLFVQKFNEILENDGLQFTYQPDFSKPLQTGFGFEKLAASVCDEGSYNQEPIVCDYGVGAGHCYCSEDFRLGARCRCGRIGSKAIKETCGAIPADCDRGQWAVAIWGEHGAANEWLTHGTYGSKSSGQKKLSEAQSPADIVCMGSPIILDLNNDGIELSDVKQGVQFSLNGINTVNTAWVKGADDALLAIDRNGNGIIDNGSELFGEALTLNGYMPADGFDSLSAVDQTNMGGNNNGLIEAGDLLFDQLVLWRDSNRDGISQLNELSTLAQEGIATLNLRKANRNQSSDRYGNELSLRSTYIRTDGQCGTLVDVYFVTH